MPWSIVSGVRSSCEAVDDERAPRGLLAAQLLLHARERAGEVADLVAAAVARGGRVRALGADPQRTARRRASRRSSVLENITPSTIAASRPIAGGGEQRVADLLGGRGHLRQLALGHEHAVRALGAVEQADGDA